MKLLKGASIYLVSNILNAAIPFLLLPILTRYLSHEEYGQIAIFQTILTGINTFIGLNTIEATTRKYFDTNKNDNLLREFNGSCLQILFISSLMIIILALFFKGNLDFFSIPANWIITAVIISIFNFIISLRLVQWQIRNKAKSFGILQLTNSLVNMSLTLVLAIYMKQGAQGRIDAQLITSLTIASISLLLIYRDNLVTIISWNWLNIKEALKFGLPLLPHNIGVFIISSIDRFFITQKLGIAETGIYMVAVQLSSSLAIVFNSLYQAYIPWLFERLKRNNQNEKKTIVKNTYIYFILLIIAAALSFITGPFFVILIAGEKYSSVSNIIGWLCLGQIFGGMYLIMSGYIYYSKKTSNFAFITLFSGSINIILLYLFIDSFGLLGAAVSYAITKFIQFIIVFLISKKITDMPWGKIFQS
ncbi:lipopolysaccharide biosynthesis protein [Xenorhabdus sp. KJ12.1]|uniref:lipopolysaccharide biosynthesis protein n=1 Tax=Xenorhabdus sp. KJ12.1 TaxID=1851571 RepID=UPI000C042CD2|nr:oligosaccharide flippase family protein [Xenorhabdus sp. KJ12.1]PHM68341.1 putative polysaccharide biosynthesis protein [Xenorhabdus sp. KJ12.1]